MSYVALLPAVFTDPLYCFLKSVDLWTCRQSTTKFPNFSRGFRNLDFYIKSCEFYIYPFYFNHWVGRTKHICMLDTAHWATVYYSCYNLSVHQTLLSPPDTSTAGCHFFFGSASSFFLEQFLRFSPVSYWTPTDLGGSSFSVISFCFFILFMGFSRQKVCHFLLQWTMFHQNSPPWPFCLGWRALLGMTHCFLGLHKVVIHVIILVSFLWLWFSFCLPSDGWG